MDGSAAIDAVQTLVGVLSTVQGRKSLLYVGDGVPIHPGEELYNLLSDVFESDRRFAQSGPAAASANPASGAAPARATSPPEAVVLAGFPPSPGRWRIQPRP